MQKNGHFLVDPPDLTWDFSGSYFGPPCTIFDPPGVACPYMLSSFRHYIELISL
jgi:hypothetical protein